MPSKYNKKALSIQVKGQGAQSGLALVLTRERYSAMKGYTK
jgi:hypothetical protein